MGREGELQAAEETGRLGPVNRTMVASQYHGHNPVDTKQSVHRYRSGLHRAHPQDSRLRRIDDSFRYFRRVDGKTPPTPHLSAFLHVEAFDFLVKRYPVDVQDLGCPGDVPATFFQYPLNMMLFHFAQ